MLLIFASGCAETPPEASQRQSSEALQAESSPVEQSSPTPSVTGKVIVVKDGDTIVVLKDQEQITVRLEGIDCPESAQAFGAKAKQTASDLCFGKPVTLKTTGKDRYGRTLADVILPDGRSLNLELVRSGYAWWYRKYSKDGLRCPSELAGLRWSHFLWDQERLIVHSPKTEHCGKRKRIVPIFGELKSYLLDAHERAPDHADRVFSDIDEETNLRTETLRIMERAGITEEVPRFYQNCRSSRETELEEEFPLHVVCKWMGNSERTARRHYLKVKESHFDHATSLKVHERVQQMAARCSEPSQAEEAKDKKTLER
ncbi:MAG: thermonuclease family protein [Fuerstiella sp.]